jgi:hypothetical protein
VGGTGPGRSEQGQDGSDHRRARRVGADCASRDARINDLCQDWRMRSSSDRSFTKLDHSGMGNKCVTVGIFPPEYRPTMFRKIQGERSDFYPRFVAAPRGRVGGQARRERRFRSLARPTPPSRHGRFRRSSNRPFSSIDSRSVAMGGRARYRPIRSRPSRSLAARRVAACRLYPSIWAQSLPITKTSRSAGAPRMRMMRHPFRGPVPTTPLADASASASNKGAPSSNRPLGPRRTPVPQLAFDPTEDGGHNPRHVLVPRARRTTSSGVRVDGPQHDHHDDEVHAPGSGGRARSDRRARQLSCKARAK